ncbi:hypothetical protein RFI_25908 [Reticulomyxa filosa]|uniref:Uncharacterized protein n=1 Tax=Reticulomyxa filosa TaxID=46433 RepID=X6MBT3_RETFI|nr:hypothetical protein RFI_25908 [Reticulomyxa filosa]|eukprot:ETO11468.1 hypothetical protein RFI_25908 [Reticulomyxa filosa]
MIVFIVFNDKKKDLKMEKRDGKRKNNGKCELEKNEKKFKMKKKYVNEKKKTKKRAKKKSKKKDQKKKKKKTKKRAKKRQKKIKKDGKKIEEIRKKKGRLEVARRRGCNDSVGEVCKPKNKKDFIVVEIRANFIADQQSIAIELSVYVCVFATLDLLS